MTKQVPEDPLIAVDDIDPEVFLDFQLRANPKLKPYKSSVSLAVKKFKEDFEGGHFRLSEMSEKLNDYINKALDETIGNVVDGLIIKGIIKVRQKGEKEMVSLTKKGKRIRS